jgi:DnaJ-class molecular chaperone
MEIRPEHLFHKCSACAGTGTITAPREPGEAAPAAESGTPCDRCDGRGLMLTDTGTVLRAFFQMLQDGKI